MKTFVNILPIFVGLSIVGSAGFAGDGPSDHSHGSAITEAKISELASAEMQNLVKAKKLDTTWDGTRIKGITRSGAAKDWVVRFENDKASDPSKRSLFVIISAEGEVKAVNHKGIQKAHSHGNGAAHAH